METKKTNSIDKSFIFIFITILIDMMGIGIIVPVFPKLIESLTGETIENAALIGGFLIASYAAAQFLFAPIMGELSDRFGRKPILLLALFGLGLDYFIHAFSPTVAWLFLGRILAGVFGASHTVAFAYIADKSTKENKARNFGMIGAAFGLGFVLGPGLGGLIGGNWGVQAPFFVAGGLSILNFLFGFLFLQESLPIERRRKIEFRRMIPFVSLANLGKYKAVLGFILAFGLAQLAGQVMPSTWSFFTIKTFNWSEGDVGLSLMVVGVLVSVVQAGLTGFMVKKYGNRKVIILGFSLWTIGMFGFSFAGNAFYLYAFTVPYVMGGIAGPTIQGIVSNRVAENEQGNLQGVLTSLGSLSAILAPLIYNSLFSFYSSERSPVYFPGAPFLLGAIILVLATIVAIISIKSVLPKSNDAILDDEHIQPISDTIS